MDQYKILGEVKFRDTYTDYSRYNNFEKLPEQIEISYNNFDSFTHFILGLIGLFTIAILYFLTNLQVPIPLMISILIMSVLFLGIPYFRRKEDKQTILLKKDKLEIGSKIIYWSEIKKIEEIQFTLQQSRQGIPNLKISLSNGSHSFVLLDRKKVSEGERTDISHFFYMFWRRACKNIGR
jgi:hypothetical protein